MLQRHRSVRRGFTLIEFVIVAFVIVLLIGLLWPTTIRCGVSSHFLTCSTRVNQVHKGMILYANDFGGLFPTPMVISPETAAVNPQSGNSSANFYSYMIFNTYYSPEVVTCPSDVNPNLVVKADYRYGTLDDVGWEDAWQWDPNFSADLTQPGTNVSYATLAMIGDRRANQWRDSLDPNFAVVADCGPKDGAWDATSLTLLRHGKRNDWTGNVGYNDGHVSAMTFRKGDKALFQVNGDNLFRVDDATKGADMWLGLFGATDETATTPYWD